MIDFLSNVYFFFVDMLIILHHSWYMWDIRLYSLILDTFGWLPHFEIYIFVILSSIGLFYLTRLVLGKQAQSVGEKGFWVHQNLAKRKIIWLNVLFALMLFLIFITAFGLFSDILLAFESDPTRKLTQTAAIALALSFVLVLVILVAYIIKSLLMRSHSIDRLAKSLEATEITPDSASNLNEKRLLNICLLYTSPSPRDS